MHDVGSVSSTSRDVFAISAVAIMALLAIGFGCKSVWRRCCSPAAALGGLRRASSMVKHASGRNRRERIRHARPHISRGGRKAKKPLLTLVAAIAIALYSELIGLATTVHAGDDAGKSWDHVPGTVHVDHAQSPVQMHRPYRMDDRGHAGGGLNRRGLVRDQGRRTDTPSIGSPIWSGWSRSVWPSMLGGANPPMQIYFPLDAARQGRGCLGKNRWAVVAPQQLRPPPWAADSTMTTTGVVVHCRDMLLGTPRRASAVSLCTCTGRDT